MKFTTFSNGSLGSRNDEERSEMRYVMWIADFRESSNLWTHIALLVLWQVCLFECRHSLTRHSLRYLWSDLTVSWLVSDAVQHVLATAVETIRILRLLQLAMTVQRPNCSENHANSVGTCSYLGCVVINRMSCLGGMPIGCPLANCCLKSGKTTRWT